MMSSSQGSTQLASSARITSSTPEEPTFDREPTISRRTSLFDVSPQNTRLLRATSGISSISNSGGHKAANFSGKKGRSVSADIDDTTAGIGYNRVQSLLIQRSTAAEKLHLQKQQQQQQQSERLTSHINRTVSLLDGKGALTLHQGFTPSMLGLQRGEVGLSPLRSQRLQAQSHQQLHEQKKQRAAPPRASDFGASSGDDDDDETDEDDDDDDDDDDDEDDDEPENEADKFGRSMTLGCKPRFQGTPVKPARGVVPGAIGLKALALSSGDASISGRVVNASNAGVSASSAVSAVASGRYGSPVAKGGVAAPGGNHGLANRQTSRGDAGDMLSRSVTIGEMDSKRTMQQVQRRAAQQQRGAVGVAALTAAAAARGGGGIKGAELRAASAAGAGDAREALDEGTAGGVAAGGAVAGGAAAGAPSQGMRRAGSGSRLAQYLEDQQSVLPPAQPNPIQQRSPARGSNEGLGLPAGGGIPKSPRGSLAGRKLPGQFRPASPQKSALQGDGSLVNFKGLSLRKEAPGSEPANAGDFNKSVTTTGEMGYRGRAGGGVRPLNLGGAIADPRLASMRGTGGTHLYSPVVDSSGKVHLPQLGGKPTAVPPYSPLLPRALAGSGTGIGSGAGAGAQRPARTVSAIPRMEGLGRASPGAGMFVAHPVSSPQVPQAEDGREGEGAELPMLPGPGVAQVVQCQHCTQLLEIPSVLPPTRKGVHKLRCGKCLLLSRYRTFSPHLPASQQQQQEASQDSQGHIRSSSLSDMESARQYAHSTSTERVEGAVPTAGAANNGSGSSPATATGNRGRGGSSRRGPGASPARPAVHRPGLGPGGSGTGSGTGSGAGPRAGPASGSDGLGGIQRRGSFESLRGSSSPGVLSPASSAIESSSSDSPAASGEKRPTYSRCVVVNGEPISDDQVAEAEQRAGPIQPGNYWYDKAAGFWGQMGGPCLGMIPPGIDLGPALPRSCSSGDTRVFVNGRELHRKDLDRLVRRGLPLTDNMAYRVEMNGNVFDGLSGEFLVSLGKLAPSLDNRNRGAGMRVPDATK
ncbi:hypothetical protein CLOM_g5209 [Closterium sp. NIES-68]|nr:hypothetical protein CLOM_g5209 [Closterium sp. NIES-68]GJP63729.1 hypothetical protein CLOP_g20781 [Closterium sp. NIES-67]